jgi:AcrR family transcriptional regulator
MDKKQEALIKSTIKLMQSKPFDDIYIAEIAEDANVPLGNVYNYFRTKKELKELLKNKEE